MYLDRYERRHVYNFLRVYLGSMLLVVSVVGYLIFIMQKDSLLQEQYHKMKDVATSKAYEAISAQMRGTDFSYEIANGDFTIAYFNKKRQSLFGSINIAPSKTNEFFKKSGCYYFNDITVQGHMGIERIFVENCHVESSLVALQRHTLLYMILIYLTLGLIGLYLAYLFLQPFRQKFRTIENFIKESTHELNTPITTLNLALFNIEKKEIDIKNLQTMKMSAQLISHIYRDLSFLTFRNEVLKEEVDVAEILEKSIGYFNILASKKSINIERKIEPVHIIADKDRLELLFRNLISNAIKYTSLGGTVAVELSAQEFKICDTGEGIDAENINDIFIRYRRFNTTTGGFGIGLDIVKQICDEMRWKIDVISNKGKGSCFMVTI